MSEQIVKTAKDPLVALAESVERTVLHGWRWFIDDTWIVFEVPAPAMQHGALDALPARATSSA